MPIGREARSGLNSCAQIRSRSLQPSFDVLNMSGLNFEKDLEKALQESLSAFPDVNDLKAEQKLVVEKIVKKRDVFAQLPTGFGKSITFQVLPAVCKYLFTLGHKFPENPLVVVVCPLLAIMEDQVKWLRSLGLKAAFVGESKAKDKQILDGQLNFNFLYGSPESLVGDERFRAMFSKEFYQSNTVAVVCDEVHTVVHW